MKRCGPFSRGARRPLQLPTPERAPHFNPPPPLSQKANPTTIGLFIVVGLGLLLGGLLLFSSGKWFRTTEKYIVYFDTSLQGLEAGAPVKYRGVTIGRVVEVLIAHNQA